MLLRLLFLRLPLSLFLRLLFGSRRCLRLLLLRLLLRLGLLPWLALSLLLGLLLELSLLLRSALSLLL